MSKMDMVTFTFAVAVASTLMGCMAPEGAAEDPSDEAERATLEAGDPEAPAGETGAAREQVKPPDDVAAGKLAAAAGVDWRICWPVAGLYYDACGTGVRENMQSGTAIEYAGHQAWCGTRREPWYYVRNLWTGHHGWVRAGALSC